MNTLERLVGRKQEIQSCKHTKNYGNSPCLKGKLTNYRSKGQSSIAILTCQRLPDMNPDTPIQHHSV